MRPKRDTLLDLSANIVVLAVDTARRSGWAIRHAHRLKYSGEIDTLDYEGLEQVCALAANISRNVYLPRSPVLVLERPWGGRLNVLVALGMARERWCAAWARVGLPAARIASAYPSQWRAAVLAHGAHRLPREAVRERERLSAQAEVRKGVELGADECAAILMSKWATRAKHIARMGGHR